MKKFISVLIIALTMNTTVFASDSFDDLTISEATSKAISYSNTLKTLEESATLAEESYNEVVSYYLITDTSQEALNLVTRLRSALNELSNISASQELTKQTIELNVVNFFYNILAAEEELELYKENLEIAAKELEIARIKKELGLISESEYNSQKLSYEKQKATLSSKETAIDDAYTSLNNVLGNSTDKRYNLILDEEYLTFSPISETGVSLISYINKGISNSNQIEQLEQAVDLAKYQVDTFTALSSSSLQSLRISYAQAQRSLSEAKTNLEQSITSLYNNILQLEENYELKLKEIEEQELNVIQLEVKYSLGTATELEVIKAKYELETLKLELESIIFNHNIYKIKLENINLA